MNGNKTVATVVIQQDEFDVGIYKMKHYDAMVRVIRTVDIIMNTIDALVVIFVMVKIVLLFAIDIIAGILQILIPKVDYIIRIATVQIDYIFDTIIITTVVMVITQVIWNITYQLNVLCYCFMNVAILFGTSLDIVYQHNGIIFASIIYLCDFDCNKKNQCYFRTTAITKYRFHKNIIIWFELRTIKENYDNNSDYKVWETWRSIQLLKGKNDFNATITIMNIIDVSTFTSFSNTLITIDQTGSNSIKIIGTSEFGNNLNTGCYL